MALDLEGVVDGSVGGEKPLRRSLWLEALHPSFSLSNRQVRILRPIVAPSAGNVLLRHAGLMQCCPVGWQFIGYHFIRRIPLLFEQFARQFERCFLDSTGLDQDIQHFILVVDGTPEVQPFTVDGDKHLVQVPATICPGSKAPQLAGIGLTIS